MVVGLVWRDLSTTFWLRLESRALYTIRRSRTPYVLEEVGLGLLSSSALPEIRGHRIWFSVDYHILISDHIMKLQRGTTLTAFYTSHDERLTGSVHLGMNFNIIMSRRRRYKVAKCRSDFSASCNSQPLSSSIFPYHVILNWPESKFWSDAWVPVY